MKKLLGFIILCIPLYVWGDNLIFNPGFDMSPWDTGWTKQAISYGGFRGDSFKYCSSPRSCKMWSGEDITGHFIYQEVSKVVNCTCRVYYQYVLDAVCDSLGGGIWASTEVAISVIIDGVWREEWAKSVHADSEQPHEHSEDTVWTKWERVYGDTDVVSGIQFKASCKGWIPWPGLAYESAELWIDDVYISGEEVGIEEDSKLQIVDCKVEISPNPFIQSTTIKYHLPAKSKVSLKIYDITGRKVKTLVSGEKDAGNYSVGFNTKELTTGIYFAKLVVSRSVGTGEFKETKKLTILR